jgi:Ca-activated chloride channel family protein
MAGIARSSGGNYYYISQPELIPEVFRKELHALMTIVARNIHLKLSLSRWVQLRQVYGRQFSMSNPRQAEVALSDLERGMAMSVLCEFEFAPRPAGVYRIAKACLSYDDAVTGKNEVLTADIEFEFTPDKAAVDSGVNPVVKQELEIALASRNLEKTVME